MACTAAMTVSSATAYAGQTVVATCTVTNGGAGSLNVSAIVPVVCPTGVLNRHVAAAKGNPPLLPNMPVDVAGSNGTRAFSWPVSFHAPTSGYGLSEPASQVYDVGATVTMSDGSIVTASTTTVTVANPSHT